MRTVRYEKQRVMLLFIQGLATASLISWALLSKKAGGVVQANTRLSQTMSSGALELICV